MGARLALLTPSAFLAEQIPPSASAAMPSTPLSPAAAIIILQTGNIYLLLAAVAVIVCFVGNPRTVRNYLLVIALADLGHVWGVYRGLSLVPGGMEAFWDWRGWNGMVAGNVGASVFLCVNRVATLVGVWGRLRGVERTMVFN